MFSKMKAVAAAAAIAGVVALGGASNASAFNIGTVGTPVGSGSMAISASAGASRLVVNGALPLNCTTTAAASAGPTPAIVTGGGFTFPRTIVSIQPTFSSCVGPSGFVFTVACVNTSSLTVNSLAGSVTSGRLAGISCTISFTALGCTAVASGSVPGVYTNPTTTAAGVLTVQTAGQSLTVSGSTCPAAVLPNGTAQFGAPSGAGTGLANLNYTLTGASTGHPFFS
jgi:hypothetical protein